MALLCAGSVATPALADDTQAWGTVTLNAGLGGPLRAASETVVRTSEGRGLYEVEQNLMLGYRFDPHVTVWLGYTLNPQYLHGSHVVTENRFRQQISFDNIAKIGRINVSARLRLEERWRPGLAQAAWRLRPYVKLSLPVHGKTALNLTHEGFIDLNTTGFQRVPGNERSRTGLSLSTPIARNVSLDVGYLNQHGYVHGGPDNDDHIATLGLSASF